MKIPFVFLSLAIGALAAPVEKLGDFELSDQDEKARAYKFPKPKVTVMTVADHKGSNQLPPWIQSVHDRYGERVDIDGIADVSMIPKPFHAMFRRAFRKELTYSVMLDWGGSVVKQFAHQKGVANIYVIDRGGRILMHLAGPRTGGAERKLFAKIDRVIKGAPAK